MRFFATFALIFIFILLAFASVVSPAATVPALAVLLLLPVVAYLEHANKIIGG